MRLFVDAKNNLLVLVAALSIALAMTFVSVYPTSVGAVGVGVVLCNGNSTITVSQPESDTIVTESDLTIKGTVSQATQIEIMLDDVFDSVVPLNLGQTTYDTSVHLTPGTHTIKLTAIDACESGQDTSTTLIITYTPPPVRNADGEIINPAGGNNGGINNSDEQITAPNSGFTLPEPFRSGVDTLLRVLDIKSPQDSGGYSHLSLTRALLLTFGLYLATFGAVTWAILKIVITAPIIRKLGRDVPTRTRIAKWFLRIVGVLLFLGSLFL